MLLILLTIMIICTAAFAIGMQREALKLSKLIENQLRSDDDTDESEVDK